MSILENAYNNRAKKINKIEEVKQLKPAISVYNDLEAICANGLDNLKDEDGKFFLKCFGLFLKPDNTFMLRVRIPAGQLTPAQAIKLGEVAKEYANDYIDITTRQQLELRFLKLENLATVLKELDSVGITTFQTGIDNFRNIVTSSFDGLGDYSLIKTYGLIQDMQSLFLKNDAFIGTLPRKFNTAILGTTVNDCNIYGHDCCFVVAQKEDVLGFNLYLGGKVGVQASDSGIFVTQEQVTKTYLAIISLFKQYGYRDNRNKNRLHFLLQDVGMENFIAAVQKESGLTYQTSGEILCTQEHKLSSDGIIALDESQKAVHFSVPSGIFSGSALAQAGELAQKAKGSIRLSVEQSLYIICENEQVKSITQSDLFNQYKNYQNIFFHHQVACAGTATCSFAVIPNKPDAIELSEYLSQNIRFDDESKIRLYWSACPKGCGIHGIADIGFEGCKAKDSEGNRCDGVHIFLGGKATQKAQEATVLYKALPLSEAKVKVLQLLEFYKNNKLKDESFESFHSRLLDDLSSEAILAQIEQ
jgi:ferredoxin-nitrite reductase